MNPSALDRRIALLSFRWVLALQPVLRAGIIRPIDDTNFDNSAQFYD